MSKTVLVTGGTVRLGKCIADCLRETGWRVLTTSHRPDAGADICVDFGEDGAAGNAADALNELLDGEPLDALVNNAAVYDADFGRSENADRCSRINNSAPFDLALAVMEKSVKGCVVNILDANVMGMETIGTDDIYASTKRHLQINTFSLAEKLAPNVRVNAVAPGCVFPPVGKHEKAAQRLSSNAPQGRDVARAVAFLLENESVNGVVLPVDGGQVDRIRRQKELV